MLCVIVNDACRLSIYLVEGAAHVDVANVDVEKPEHVGTLPLLSLSVLPRHCHSDAAQLHVPWETHDVYVVPEVVVYPGPPPRLVPEQTPVEAVLLLES